MDTKSALTLLFAANLGLGDKEIALLETSECSEHDRFYCLRGQKFFGSFCIRLAFVAIMKKLIISYLIEISSFMPSHANACASSHGMIPNFICIYSTSQNLQYLS